MYSRDIKQAKAKSPTASRSAREPYHSCWSLRHIQDHPVYSTSLLAPSGANSESGEGTRYAAVLPSYVGGCQQCMIKGKGCSWTGRALVGRRVGIACNFYGQMLWMGSAG